MIDSLGRSVTNIDNNVASIKAALLQDIGATTKTQTPDQKKEQTALDKLTKQLDTIISYKMDQEIKKFRILLTRVAKCCEEVTKKKGDYRKQAAETGKAIAKAMGGGSGGSSTAIDKVSQSLQKNLIPSLDKTSDQFESFNKRLYESSRILTSGFKMAAAQLFSGIGNVSKYFKNVGKDFYNDAIEPIVYNLSKFGKYLGGGLASAASYLKSVGKTFYDDALEPIIYNLSKFGKYLGGGLASAASYLKSVGKTFYDDALEPIIYNTKKGGSYILDGMSKAGGWIENKLVNNRFVKSATTVVKTIAAATMRFKKNATTATVNAAAANQVDLSGGGYDTAPIPGQPAAAGRRRRRRGNRPLSLTAQRQQQTDINSAAATGNAIGAKPGAFLSKIYSASGNDVATSIGSGIGKVGGKLASGIVGAVGTFFGGPIAGAAAGGMAGGFTEGLVDFIFKPVIEGFQRVDSRAALIYSQLGAKGREAADAQKDLTISNKDFLDTGLSEVKLEKVLVKNRQKGLKDEKEALKVTKTGAFIGSQIGANAEETANMFGDWSIHLGLSSKQLNTIARDMLQISRTTGLTGDNLTKIAKDSQQFLSTMRLTGTLTASAASNIMGLLAQGEVSGISPTIQRVLNTLKKSTLNPEDPAMSDFLTMAAGRRSPATVQNLITGTATNKKDFKAIGEGMMDFVKQLTGGRSVKQLTPEEAGELSSVTERATRGAFKGIKELELAAQAMLEKSKDVGKLIEDINKNTRMSAEAKNTAKEKLLYDTAGKELNSFNEILERVQANGGGINQAFEELKKRSTDLAPLMEALGKDTNKASDVLGTLADLQYKQVQKGISQFNLQGKLGKDEVTKKDFDDALAALANNNAAPLQEITARLDATQQRIAREQMKADNPVLQASEALESAMNKVRDAINDLINRALPLITKLADQLPKLVDILEKIFVWLNKYLKLPESVGNITDTVVNGAEATASTKDLADTLKKSNEKFNAADVQKMTPAEKSKERKDNDELIRRAREVLKAQDEELNEPITLGRIPYMLSNSFIGRYDDLKKQRAANVEVLGELLEKKNKFEQAAAPTGLAGQMNDWISDRERKFLTAPNLSPEDTRRFNAIQNVFGHAHDTDNDTNESRYIRQKYGLTAAQQQSFGITDPSQLGEQYSKLAGLQYNQGRDVAAKYVQDNAGSFNMDIVKAMFDAYGDKLPEGLNGKDNTNALQKIEKTVTEQTNAQTNSGSIFTHDIHLEELFADVPDMIGGISDAIDAMMGNATVSTMMPGLNIEDEIKKRQLANTEDNSADIEANTGDTADNTRRTNALLGTLIALMGSSRKSGTGTVEGEDVDESVFYDQFIDYDWVDTIARMVGNTWTQGNIGKHN